MSVREGLLLLNVYPPLLVNLAARVRVSKLIDENDLRVPLDNRRAVEGISAGAIGGIIAAIIAILAAVGAAFSGAIPGLKLPKLF